MTGAAACRRCGQVHERCNGHTGGGAPCRRHPIIGGTVCPKHGGSARQVKAAAGRRVARVQALAYLERLGQPREVDPATALIEEVWRAAGHVAYIGHVLAQLSRDDLVQEDRAGFQKASVWAEMYGDWSDRLARTAKMSVDVGIDRALVEIAQVRADATVRLVDNIVRALGHNPDDAGTQEIVHREFTAIAGGAGAS